MIETRYLHQLFLRPDLNGLHLLRGLSLNAIGVEEDLQSERHKQDRDNQTLNTTLLNIRCVISATLVESNELEKQ